MDRARESLEKQSMKCSDLSVLVRHSTKNRLFGLIQDSKSIAELFLRLADYWSFFDYEFLSLIIERHCQELKQDLKNYESSFIEYSKRRLCELPTDVFENRGDGQNLYVQIDRNFDMITVEDIKKLEGRLSELLKTELYLLKIEEGCILLTFLNLCGVSTLTTLNIEQVKAFNAMKVMRLRSNNFEYFNSTATNVIGVTPKENYFNPRHKLIGVSLKPCHPLFAPPMQYGMYTPADKILPPKKSNVPAGKPSIAHSSSLEVGSTCLDTMTCNSQKCQDSTVASIARAR